MDDVNQITGYVQQFNNTLKPAIEGRLASIQSKLAALKQRIAKVCPSILFLTDRFVGIAISFNFSSICARNGLTRKVLSFETC